MGEWNSRGLRGSAFEELINLTIERYRELGLALIQKVPTPITPIQIDQATRHIMKRKVRWIISELYKESRFALTRKNVQKIPFPCRMFMNTNLRLWKSLNDRKEWHFFLSIILQRKSFII